MDSAALPAYLSQAMSLLIPLALLILSIPLVIGLLRINELFYLEIKRGKLKPVRGRIPRQLLSDIEDIVERVDVETAQLRAVVEDGRVCIYAHGKSLPRPLRQRLRNTISLWPLAKIRNAPRIRRWNAGKRAKR